jgi:peptidoglycan hydrolase-like protein with peptidoglycan-binding domain
MRATGYYEGFGKTVEDRIANHARAMAKGINRALVVIGAGPIEVPPSAIVEIPDTVRFGSIGETVKLAQRELRLAADGIFGKVTRGATIAYQQQHGLVADGIVGPQTWKKLLSDDYIPAAA